MSKCAFVRLSIPQYTLAFWYLMHEWNKKERKGKIIKHDKGKRENCLP